MPLRYLSLLVLFALVFLSAADDDDDDDGFSRFRGRDPKITHNMMHRVAHSSGSYEFYYHTRNNLLLTVHNDECYYAALDKEDYQRFFKYDPKGVEALIMDSVNHNHNRQSTNLHDMRSRFQDLLADFHCVGKSVYTLNVKDTLRSAGGSSDDSDSSDEDD